MIDEKSKKIKEIILLRLGLELKKHGWNVGGSTKNDNLDKKILTLDHGDVILPMTVNIPVYKLIDSLKISDDVSVFITLFIESDDNITYYTLVELVANLNISIIDADVRIVLSKNSSGGLYRPIEIPIAFTENDLKNDNLYGRCAGLIEDSVREYISKQYSDFVLKNERNIMLANMGANPEQSVDKLDKI